MTQNTHWLAEKFIIQREIIEAAETPFSKLAMFILPIISPLVPATMTGMHLYQIFLETFTFPKAEYLSGILAIVSGVVLELLGYVGAVTFIKSIFNYFSTRREEYLIPMLLNGFAYLFYLILLWMINYLLGRYLGVDPLLNNIIAALSFVTVPTSLLAGSHLSEKFWEERQSEIEKRSLEHEQLSRAREDALRKEQADLELSRLQMEQSYKLERYRVKQGKVSTGDLESSNHSGKIVESSKKVPDWRQMNPTQEQIEEMARWTPDQMKVYASETGRTYKTLSNYRSRARKLLGMSEEE